MNEQERQSVLTLCLMAAFADGDKHERERAEIRRIAASLAGDGDTGLAARYQDVLLGRVDLAEAVRGLDSVGSKQLAYEMAVCVCDADGLQSAAERAFLERLREALGLAAEAAREHSERAEAIAALPLAGAADSTVADRSDAVLDKQILDAAILNGALELLPETLASMAIIPLQMRLVYRIGKAHGHELDSGHVKDFLATAGVGLTSQYLEQAGRKLFGGLLGAIGGGLLGGLGRQAVSSGMSFTSTYALGHVAKRYYAGGRRLSTQMLREAFDDMRGQATRLRSQYLPQMQEQARSLDVAKILQTVRGA
mgnify:CR=1 FL=1